MAKVKRRVGGPAWQPGEPTLTASGIAEALRPIAPDVPGTVQKIRYWTREEMLLPVAQQHAGTGRHRQYADTAVFDAAILFTAAAVGLNVSAHRHLVDALTLARFAWPKWLEAKQRGQAAPLFLKIAQTDNHRMEVEVDNQFPIRGTEMLICIDLDRLWSKVLAPQGSRGR
jgi:DNA-binding transcriptional MerR regulator